MLKIMNIVVPFRFDWNTCTWYFIWDDICWQYWLATRFSIRLTCM